MNDVNVNNCSHLKLWPWLQCISIAVIISENRNPTPKGMTQPSQVARRDKTALAQRMLTCEYAIAMNNVTAAGRVGTSNIQAIATVSTQSVAASNSQKITGGRCG